MRFDVPVIGLKTIETMRQAGATCLRWMPRSALLDGDAIPEMANAYDILLWLTFVVAFRFRIVRLPLLDGRGRPPYASLTTSLAASSNATGPSALPRRGTRCSGPLAYAGELLVASCLASGNLGGLPHRCFSAGSRVLDVDAASLRHKCLHCSDRLPAMVAAQLRAIPHAAYSFPEDSEPRFRARRWCGRGCSYLERRIPSAAGRCRGRGEFRCCGQRNDGRAPVELVPAHETERKTSKAPLLQQSGRDCR